MINLDKIYKKRGFGEKTEGKNVKTDSKKELFENMPVPKAIAAMAIPTIISQLINVVYNIVDTFFIGRTGDPYKVGAATLAFTLVMLTVAFSNLFGIGGGSLTARLLGQGREEDARRVSAFSFYGGLGIALAYSLLTALFMDPLLRLLGASQDTIGYTRQYVWLVIVIGGVPVILSAVGAHLLRNVGYSRQASFGLSCGGILNIALDPLFMFVLLPKGMEVFGAALATLLANTASCIYMFIALFQVSRKAAVSIDPRRLREVSSEDVKAVFAVGVPSAVLTGLFDIANIVLNNQMAAHGDLELAAIGIVMKPERLPNMVNIGLCQGMLPIVAYNYSSGNRARMQEVIRTGRVIGIVSFMSLAVFELFAAPIVSVFLDVSAGDTVSAAATVAMAAGFMRVRCLASPIQFLNYHTSYCLQAMGDGRDTLLHAAARQLVFYIPCMLLFNQIFGIDGLIWAIIIGESCGAVFALVLLRLWLRRMEKPGAAG